METQAALSKIQADAILASHTLSCGKYRNCNVTGDICLEYETLLTDKERRAIQEFLSRIFDQTKKPRQLYESAPGQNQKVKGEYQMNEIIAIQKSTIGTEVKQTVNARDLHEFLEVGKDFTTWVKVQIDRARLVENRDFVVFTQKGENLKGGRPTAEYHLTLDAGKHVSMMSNTDKGFEVRDYFLECEKIVQTTTLLTPAASPEIQIAQAMLLAGRMIEEQKLQIVQRDKLIAITAPKAAIADRILVADGLFSFRQVAKMLLINENKFRKWLVTNDWIYYLGGRMTGKAGAIRRGFIETKIKMIPIEGQDDKAVTDMFFTCKGVHFLTGELGQQEMLEAA